MPNVCILFPTSNHQEWRSETILYCSLSLMGFEPDLESCTLRLHHGTSPWRIFLTNILNKVFLVYNIMSLEKKNFETKIGILIVQFILQGFLDHEIMHPPWNIIHDEVTGFYFHIFRLTFLRDFYNFFIKTWTEMSFGKVILFDVCLIS